MFGDPWVMRHPQSQTAFGFDVYAKILGEKAVGVIYLHPTKE
jgi:hypothetical protein